MGDPVVGVRQEVKRIFAERLMRSVANRCSHPVGSRQTVDDVRFGEQCAGCLALTDDLLQVVEDHSPQREGEKTVTPGELGGAGVAAPAAPPADLADMEDPLKALKRTLACSADDWGTSRAMAWVWGIILGWDDEDGDALPDLADKFGWPDDAVAHLRRLHDAFNALNDSKETDHA